MTQQKRLIAFPSWIPTDADLWDKPEVLEIHETTDLPRSQVVGLLIRMWCWMSKVGRFEADNGSLVVDAPPRRLVTITSGEGQPAFWEAVAQVGWLVIEDRSLSIPHADAWLSPQARKRLLDTERKRAERSQTDAALGCPRPVRDLSEGCPRFVRGLSEKRPPRGEEKRERREDQDFARGRAREAPPPDSSTRPDPPRHGVSISDLRDPERAVELGFKLSGEPRSERVAADIRAAAARALQGAWDDPPAYFAWFCRGRRWSWLTGPDEDAANAPPGRYERGDLGSEPSQGRPPAENGRREVCAASGPGRAPNGSERLSGGQNGPGRIWAESARQPRASPPGTVRLGQVLGQFLDRRREA